MMFGLDMGLHLDSEHGHYPSSFNKSGFIFTSLYSLITTTTTTILWPFSGTTWVSWCQKKTSGLSGARED